VNIPTQAKVGLEWATMLMKTAPDLSEPFSCVSFASSHSNNRPQAATSKRSFSITLAHAATKSFTNFSFESAQA
jgi:hypothetical protein